MAHDSFFGPGEDPTLNGITHYEQDLEDVQYALGFKESADKLVEACEAHRHPASLAVMPACFLYRHSLELYLKYLFVRESALLDREPKRAPRGHKLRPHWQKLAAVLVEIDPEIEKRLRVVEELVVQFERVDVGSPAFRYSTRLEGGRDVHDPGLINLTRLREGVAPGFGLLQGVSDAMQEWEFSKGDYLAAHADGGDSSA